VLPTWTHPPTYVHDPTADRVILAHMRSSDGNQRILLRDSRFVNASARSTPLGSDHHVIDRLDKLAGLLERGLITDDELARFTYT
jgi:hypothetical protein